MTELEQRALSMIEKFGGKQAAIAECYKRAPEPHELRLMERERDYWLAIADAIRDSAALGE